MLRAVRQKLNLLAEEIGLDLVQQESGEVTFHYTQVDPNMNTEQYRIYETIILHHIKHVQNIQEYSLISHIPSRLLQISVDERKRNLPS